MTAAESPTDPMLIDNTETVLNKSEENTIKNENNENENENEKEKKELPPLEEGWIDITNDRGILKKKMIKEGYGTIPEDGSKITCHYVGTLTNTGEPFDSSRQRGEPFGFDLGKGGVIKGWDLGVASMKLGEIAILRCASEYAYGDRAQGKIPANSSLDFEIELIDWDNWQQVAGDTTNIRKKVIQEGTGYQVPETGGTVTVNYIAKYTIDKAIKNEEHWKQFAEEANVQFIVDDDDINDEQKNNARYVPGFHVALQDLKKGGKSVYMIDPIKGYADRGHAQYGIPPNATLIYEITLHEFTNPKKSWEMNVEEHFTESEIMKTKGNEAFKENKYSKALKKI